MEEKSLRVMTDKTFFSKISTTISKMLIPTRIGINGMLISLKRNALIKSYQNYMDNLNNENSTKKDALFKKYEDAYALYLEAIDKHIMDSVYKKVKNGTATAFEKDALSNYYTIINLKEKEYIEYKFRKQKYLLELDYETVRSTQKNKVVDTYEGPYLEKMDMLYKGIIKNYAVKLADNITNKYESKDKIYDSIFDTLEEYMDKIFKIKIEKDENGIIKDILEEYDKFESYSVGKLDVGDIIEKRMTLLGISRQVFTHSLPLVIAEQCYVKLLKDARKLILSVKDNKNRLEKSYNLLMNLIEEYNIKLLSTKVYWENPELREDYKNFWAKYKTIAVYRKQNLIKFLREREILFLRYDIQKLNKSKHDYREVISIHKQKLVNYGAMRNFRNKCKTLEGVKYVKKRETKNARASRSSVS